ncbi:MAG: hypothetical protein AAGA18_04300 [Verrucomicrobiota bacterium]
MNETDGFEIVFTPVSSAEISSLPKKLQLEILEQFNVLQPNFVEESPETFGRMTKDTRSIYRYRAEDYRIYFEKKDDGLIIHRVIHKNTLKDFLFRSNVPIAEDEELQKNPNFWAMIDQPGN